MSLLVACFTILSRFFAESIGSTEIEPGTNLEARSCFILLMHVNSRSERERKQMKHDYSLRPNCENERKITKYALCSCSSPSNLILFASC